VVIPERYDTMIWGIILLIAITASTVAILWAIDNTGTCQPVQGIRYVGPYLEARA
jgi:NO-binding membrane sensor protein with MHYT domain